MRINCHKSELVPINLSEEQIYMAAHIFGCPIGSFPIKYLGVLFILISSKERICNLL
jgi:hypothetical protein